jgi:ABC-2 type transport system permease protein
MLRPMNLFLQVIFEKLQPDALGELLVGTILIVISLGNGVVIMDAPHVLMFVVSIFAGAIIYTAIKLLFASFAFWIKISGPVLYTAYQFADFAKYPTDIYASGVRFIITWIIPFGFVAYLPASYFLKPGVSAFSTIGIECILAVVFFAIAYGVFTWGTRAYESAGN